MSFRKKILVTGGAGYIGSHTILELLENTDLDVVSVDNFSNSSTRTFERIARISGKEVKNYSIDLCDKAALEAMIAGEAGIEGIIHFAAFKSVPESVADPYKYYHNNINSLLNILECCIKFNLPNFIFSSSCSVYGNIDQLPVKEDTPLGFAESPYAFTKQAGERIIRDYAIAYPSLQAIALRYFNPVGAHISGLIGESPLNKPNNLVPIITSVAAGKLPSMTVFGSDYPTRDGTCVRDYVHVSDIATAHIKAFQYLEQKRNKGNFSIFNLGTGNGVSVLEAIGAFEKISGRKLNYIKGDRRSGDVGAIYSDTSLSQQELGWTPRYSLDQMMDSAWKWELNQKQEKE